jgi:hypothetical protein
MRQRLTDHATEVKRLQRCMNDLVSVLALPAVWSVSEPRRIIETLLDALMEILDLDFLYARIPLNSAGAPIDALRTAPLFGTTIAGRKLGKLSTTGLEKICSKGLKVYLGIWEVSRFRFFP